MQNYVNIYIDKGKFITMLSLKGLEENLNERSFMRVHKSYIVAINKINGIEGNEIFIQSNRIPINRGYRPEVLEKVVSKRLWDGVPKKLEEKIIISPKPYSLP